MPHRTHLQIQNSPLPILQHPHKALRRHSANRLRITNPQGVRRLFQANPPVRNQTTHGEDVYGVLAKLH